MNIGKKLLLLPLGYALAYITSEIVRFVFTRSTEYMLHGNNPIFIFVTSGKNVYVCARHSSREMKNKYFQRQKVPTSSVATIAARNQSRSIVRFDRAVSLVRAFVACTLYTRIS